eukprot:COSAG01_NODE_5885_length_3970_cov_16.893051_1_plen_245_part_00
MRRSWALTLPPSKKRRHLVVEKHHRLSITRAALVEPKDPPNNAAGRCRCSVLMSGGGRARRLPCQAGAGREGEESETKTATVLCSLQCGGGAACQPMRLHLSPHQQVILQVDGPLPVRLFGTLLEEVDPSHGDSDDSDGEMFSTTSSSSSSGSGSGSSSSSSDDDDDDDVAADADCDDTDTEAEEDEEEAGGSILDLIGDDLPSDDTSASYPGRRKRHKAQVTPATRKKQPRVAAAATLSRNSF